MNTVHQIYEDLLSCPITIIGKRKTGKSTLAKHIIKDMRDKYGNRVSFKILDPSLAWMNAPVEYLQVVNKENLELDLIENKDNCVYLMLLSKEDRRTFLATLVYDDYQKRVKDKLNGKMSDKIIVYVLEELNTYIGSYSLRGDNFTSNILNDLVSVGRNFGLTILGVCTAFSGEVAPQLRRRVELLSSKLISESDLRAIRTLKNRQFSDTTKTLKDYEFIYSNSDLQIIRLKQILEFSKPLDITRPKQIYREIKHKTDKIKQTKQTQQELPLSTLLARILVIYFIFLTATLLF